MGGDRLTLASCDFDVAADFVREHHRHHTPPQGHKFSLAAMAGDELVGVVIVGRPVARRRDDGFTLEVTRLCTTGHRCQVDTSMESGPNNCFHCERPM